MRKTVIASLLLLCLWSNGAEAQEERKFVRRGNKEYLKGRFTDAEINYMRALEIDSASVAARFNLSDALYGQGRYEDALKSLQQVSADSLQTTVPAPDVNYNTGNAYFQLKQYDKAIEAYKKSLRKNPDDPEAKFNLAYAQLMLDNQQNQQDRQDQNQQNQGQGQDQQNQDQQNQQNQDQPGQDDRDQEGNPPSQDGEQPAEGQMSRKDAEQLLQALQNNEDKTQQKVKEQKGKAVIVKGRKNW